MTPKHQEVRPVQTSSNGLKVMVVDTQSRNKLEKRTRGIQGPPELKELMSKETPLMATKMLGEQILLELNRIPKEHKTISDTRRTTHR